MALKSAGKNRMTETLAGSEARRIPSATYRLQFNAQFTFREALRIADYLDELGISDAYASPLFRAGPESTHGYDVCAYDELDPRLGSDEEFRAWTDRLKELGLRLILDVVPNHMGATQTNAWWWDVLEQGPASRYAGWFDINWQPAGVGWRDQVVLPVLEDHYEKVLEAGKLRIVVSQPTGFAVAYHERRFPLSAQSCNEILRQARQAGSSIEWQSKPARSPELVHEGQRTRHAPTDKAQSNEAWEREPEFENQVESTLRRLNGVAGEPASFDALDCLLRAQHFRLAYWRTAAQEINYRRFFDITDLISMRVELREVFQATHASVLRLINEGKISGLRVDHPDGLWDPRQYFGRLRAAAPPIYVVAEKILTRDEPLPDDWGVDGTTGYDFLYQLNNLFIDAASAEALENCYRRFTGCDKAFRDITYESKYRVLQLSFGGELNQLAHRLRALAANTRAGFDLTVEALRDALSQIVAALPVYRTYVTETAVELAPAEAEWVREAARTARSRNAGSDEAALNFVEDVLLLGLAEGMSEAQRRDCRGIAMRVQQLTGPAMAKGLEDTAFYRYFRLASLNEVGGDPGTFGLSVDSFHQYNLMKRECWPHALLATATHDTKRGEDLRARLAVLSELPDEWSRAVARWAQLNADKKVQVDGAPAPDANDEYLFYQTLLGAWIPQAESAEGLADLRQRLQAYLLKGIKEAKTHTSWTEPNAAYEQAAESFVGAVLSDSQGDRFLKDFKPFQRRIAFFGRFNSLAQVLLKMTSPGVSDFYQGTELWDFNLVDPDNRRPVDYEVRHQMLAEVKEHAVRYNDDPAGFISQLLADSDFGAVKLYLIWRALQFRREHRALFQSGQYVPLRAEGEHREHVCAFAREDSSSEAIVIAPRLPFTLTSGKELAPLGEVWGDTRLALRDGQPGRTYRNVFTNQTLSAEGHLRLSEALRAFPVALLTRIA
jgi:(1->4)-alpha-D-glucan 1-alpha-D-glucosylmutase